MVGLLNLLRTRLSPDAEDVIIIRLPQGWHRVPSFLRPPWPVARGAHAARSEEHTSELQSQSNLVCRLLLETIITHVDPVFESTDDKLWLSPAFLAPQLTALSGVDYHSPTAAIQEYDGPYSTRLSQRATAFF